MKLRFYHVLLAGPILFVWIWTWLYLTTEWSVNEQYQFGFAVPPLGLYLAWRNWPVSLSAGTKSWVVFHVLAWLVLLLAEILRLTDPFWRLTGGLWIAGATLLTVGFLAQVGGWTLVRRMLFPLCFLWLGLPWPTPLETRVIQTLTHSVAAATAAILNLGGIAALQRGNTIELSAQVVGIDAACSGIESFQASLMASVFLWGLMRLRPLAGLGLVASGLACSLVVNLGRVLVLTYAAHFLRSQNQAVHDWVGVMATLVIFGTIFLLARWLQRRGRQPAFDPPARISLPPVPTTIVHWSTATVFTVLFLAIPLVAGLICGRPEQIASSQQPRWQIDTGNLPAGWSVHTLEPTNAEKSMLRFSQWAALQVRTSDGLWASVVHLFWDRNRAIPSMAFYHTPALCMPSAGWQTIGEPESLELKVDGNPVNFVRYALQQDNERVSALQFLGRGKHSDSFFVASITGKDRWDRVAEPWRGLRDPVNEEILIYVPESSAGADIGFANELFSKLFKPRSRPPS
jgi:exosortase